MEASTYKDLIVWQKSMDLAIKIYTLTNKFPSEEHCGLTSQMRKAAVSIPSNIAEDKLRNSEKESRRFFLRSFGSGGELGTQIEIPKRLTKFEDINYSEVDILLEEVMRMLNKMITNLTPKA